jgi:hypothetical protein
VTEASAGADSVPIAVQRTTDDWRKLSICGYNPLSMSEVDRELENSHELRNMAITGLSGTARLHPKGCSAIIRRTPYHVGIHLGWARSPFVNKSCGCSILLNARIIKERDIMAVFAPPKSIQGRALAVHFRLGTQFALALVLYFPPNLQLLSIRLIKKPSTR